VIYKEFVADSCINQAGSSIRRVAVRAIVFQENKFLMLYSQTNKDYSFPGGGIESGESNHEALKRELMEECGAEIIAIDRQVAEIIEMDPAIEPDIAFFIRNTHYFLCRISNYFTNPVFSTSEKLRNNAIVWVDLEEALYNNQTLMKYNDPSPPRWVRRESFIMEQLSQHPELYRGRNID
jgi:8-oxo-dGTP pyrophosphatase MutT (NUDIX family)